MSTANVITVNGSNFYVVHTTNTSEGTDKEVQISANLRETEKGKEKGVTVTDAERYRNIWITAIELPSVEDKFRPMLLVKLYELAKSRFEAAMKDSNRLATSVPCSDYTLPALLDYFNQETISNRLSKETVEAWFATSATRTYIVGKKDEATAKKYLGYYSKLASPNHGTNPNDCVNLLAILQPADISGPTASTVAASLATRLQQTIDKSKTSQVEAL